MTLPGELGDLLTAVTPALSDWLTEHDAAVAAQAQAAMPQPAHIPVGDFGQDGSAVTIGRTFGRSPDLDGWTLPPGTSTQAARVPPQSAAPMTNPLFLAKSEKAAERWVLANVSIVGTEQGHNYHGLRLDTLTAPILSNVTVAGWWGDYQGPPGETFGVAIYTGSDALIERCTIDGQHTGATGLGANNTTRVTVTDTTIRNTRFWAAAFWQTDTVASSGLTVDGCGRGVNHERVSGPIRHDQLTVNLDGSDAFGMHLTFNNDQADNPNIVIDMAGWSGGKYGPTSPLCVKIADTYGTGQKQRSLPQITLNGTLLTWADAGRTAAPGYPAVTPQHMDEARANPTAYVVRHH